MLSCVGPIGTVSQVGGRTVFAVETAVAADYPDNAARRKFVGLMLITQQLAILLLVATNSVRIAGAHRRAYSPPAALYLGGGGCLCRTR